MIKFSSDILEIKFSGGDITPEKLTLSELSSQILLFDKLIKPIIEYQNPKLPLDKSFVGLHELGNRSISLRYKIKEHKPEILAAFALLTQSIKASDTTALPLKTIDELETISKFNQKYSCKVDFGETIENSFEPIVQFSNEYLPEKEQQIKGTTTVYGKIQWIGGDKPTITLILRTGHKIDVAVRENDIDEWRAHREVGITGDAVWKGKDLRLTRLIAREIFAFDRKSPDEGFNHLKSLFSEHKFVTD